MADQGASYFPYPPHHHMSMSALSDYLGEEHLAARSEKRANMPTQPYMYSTVKAPAPAKIAEMDHSDETESSGRAIALKPKPIAKSPF